MIQNIGLKIFKICFSCLALFILSCNKSDTTPVNQSSEMVIIQKEVGATGNHVFKSDGATQFEIKLNDTDKK